MATRFEVVLPGQNRASLRGAGEAALDETLRDAAADAEKWKRLAYQSDGPSNEAAE